MGAVATGTEYKDHKRDFATTGIILAKWFEDIA
jgi:hypothetical protein